ncbi:dTDP-4-dehydrorhamnose reductase [Geothermobacter ehrlichii]|uniref:dTDP-4-dehydrorhamnose reductase n=1 Tax=Geothermobacter ehrlichii TaxID=213224 RepID=A0A5D3WM45_9BACT|nr:dTDP-4-dehydrorhamnose reductase [Geothermobacter ehrlichii]TYP00063.1 dTDP-4-dehydrorhamnose reductase [Geothermobacter ehrlichii]
MEPARVALIGAKGMLARAVRSVLPQTAVVQGYDLPEFDLTDRRQVLDRLAAFAPTLIINCAAYTDVDGCETAEELATCVNGKGPGFLAEAAMDTGAVLVHISTDYVFDGRAECPCREEDPTAPLSAYGRSKLAGETAIRDSGLGDYLIVRTSWLYGPGGRNFVETMLRLMAEREELRVVADQVGSPTLTFDLAEAILRLLAAGGRGIVHFSNSGQCSWHQFAEAIRDEALAAGMSLKVRRIDPIATVDYPLPARRPAWSVLDKSRYTQLTGVFPPDWRQSLKRYMKTRQEG